MYTRLLVPIKWAGGGPARAALDVACALRAPGGKIIALHIVEAVPAYVEGYLPDHHMDAARAEALADLAEAVSNVEDAEPVVVTGHAARSIVDYATANGIDWIVLGSHPHEFADYLIGSTAAHVVRHAACSVHVVR